MNKNNNSKSKGLRPLLLQVQSLQFFPVQYIPHGIQQFPHFPLCHCLAQFVHSSHAVAYSAQTNAGAVVHQYILSDLSLLLATLKIELIDFQLQYDLSDFFHDRLPPWISDAGVPLISMILLYHIIKEKSIDKRLQKITKWLQKMRLMYGRNYEQKFKSVHKFNRSLR